VTRPTDVLGANCATAMPQRGGVRTTAAGRMGRAMPGFVKPRRHLPMNCCAPWAGRPSPHRRWPVIHCEGRHAEQSARNGGFGVGAKPGPRRHRCPRRAAGGNASARQMQPIRRPRHRPHLARHGGTRFHKPSGWASPGRHSPAARRNSCRGLKGCAAGICKAMPCSRASHSTCR
jgi:hypothetical protein